MNPKSAQQQRTGAPGALRAVLFDYGGVLADEGFRDGLGALAKAQRLDPQHIAAAGREAIHASGYITGRASEGAFWSRLRAETGLSGDDAALRNEVLRRFVLRPWMMAHVDALRAGGLQVAILSDQTDWLEQLDRRDGFFQHFDRIFNSWRMGRTKRDPMLFDSVVDVLRVPAAKTLFIDDTAGHCRRARERGLAAIHYRERRQLETELNELTDTDLAKN